MTTFLNRLLRGGPLPAAGQYDDKRLVTVRKNRRESFKPAPDFDELAADVLATEFHKPPVASPSERIVNFLTGELQSLETEIVERKRQRKLNDETIVEIERSISVAKVGIQCLSPKKAAAPIEPALGQVDEILDDIGEAVTDAIAADAALGAAA